VLLSILQSIAIAWRIIVYRRVSIWVPLVWDQCVQSTFGATKRVVIVGACEVWNTVAVCVYTRRAVVRVVIVRNCLRSAVWWLVVAVVAVYKDSLCFSLLRLFVGIYKNREICCCLNIRNRTVRTAFCWSVCVTWNI